MNKSPLDFKQMVTNADGQVVATSFKVAEYFNKRHDNVLRALKNMDCPSDFIALNFEEKKFTNKKGKTQSFYTMTKDGFAFLVMGFTGAKAAQMKVAFIYAFNEMANELEDLVQIYNQTSVALDTATKEASEAGRTLCKVGKQHKPFLRRRLNEIARLIQPSLFDSLSDH